MSSITTGLYASSAEAARAVRLLEECGVPLPDISVVVGNQDGTDGLAHETHSKAPEGIALGAAGGGSIGALIAGLSAAGSIATGGAGLGLIAAGPIAAALMGAGAGAAAGSAVGGMLGAAIPEHEQKYYMNAINRGSVLVGVKTDDGERQKIVTAAFVTTGAEKVS